MSVLNHQWSLWSPAQRDRAAAALRALGTKMECIDQFTGWDYADLCARIGPGAMANRRIKQGVGLLARLSASDPLPEWAQRSRSKALRRMSNSQVRLLDELGYAGMSRYHRSVLVHGIQSLGVTSRSDLQDLPMSVIAQRLLSSAISGKKEKSTIARIPPAGPAEVANTLFAAVGRPERVDIWDLRRCLSRGVRGPIQQK